MYDQYGYVFRVQLHNRPMEKEVVYARSEQEARKLLEARYPSGTSIYGGSGSEHIRPQKLQDQEKERQQQSALQEQRRAKEQEENRQKAAYNEQQRALKAQEDRLKKIELEMKKNELNRSYKEQAEVLSKSIMNINSSVQKWHKRKAELEDYINETIKKIRNEIIEFEKYSNEIQEGIDQGNKKISQHNNQELIKNENMLQSIKNLKAKLETEIDFTNRKSKRTIVTISIVLILALALIGFYFSDEIFKMYADFNN